MADITLSALWSPWRNGDSPFSSLSFLAGITLPTGEARDQPLAGVAAPSVFQLGTGAFQLLLGAQYTGAIGEWSYSTRFDLSLPLNESDEGFRPTESFYWSAGFGRPLTESLSARLSVEATHGNEDELQGAKIDETGSTVISLKPSLVWRIDQNTAASASVSLPVYREVNETQIAVGPLWTLGISRSF